MTFLCSSSIFETVLQCQDRIIRLRHARVQRPTRLAFCRLQILWTHLIFMISSLLLSRLSRLSGQLTPSTSQTSLSSMATTTTMTSTSTEDTRAIYPVNAQTFTPTIDQPFPTEIVKKPNLKRAAEDDFETWADTTNLSHLPRSEINDSSDPKKEKIVQLCVTLIDHVMEYVK